MLDNWADLEDFKAYISSLELEHFSYHEILIGIFKKRQGIVNAPPPKEIWHNIGPTVLVLDELRKFFGVPVTISSVYRAPEYNKLIGGAKRSQHLGFVAMDINARGVTPTAVAKQLLAWQDQEKWFDMPIRLTPVDVEGPEGKVPRVDLETREVDGKLQFKYKGGVGFYTTFTHMDTRGVTRSWDDRKNDAENSSRNFSLEPVILD